jgi:hypothetical protein
MEILITSKTHKGNAVCVGGMIVNSGKLVRLLNPGNWDQYANTELDIGDIWNIKFEEREDIIPPHIEDVIIHSKSFIRKIDNISDFIIKSGITIFRGSPYNIFDGLLGWTGSGGGYIGDKNNLPTNSVGFWISDKDLVLSEKYYEYPARNIHSQPKRFKYVGTVPAVNTIPSGILIRVSLARWWKPEDAEIDERCYLQLSGWYGL